MTPESAEIGLNIYHKKFDMMPKEWGYTDYPDLSNMKVFQK